jgi:hypothetical protein
MVLELHRKRLWQFVQVRKLNGYCNGRLKTERVSRDRLRFRLLTWPEARMTLAYSFLSQGHRGPSNHKVHSKDDWLRQVNELIVIDDEHEHCYGFRSKCTRMWALIVVYGWVHSFNLNITTTIIDPLTLLNCWSIIKKSI